MSKQGSTHK